MPQPLVERRTDRWTARWDDAAHAVIVELRLEVGGGTVWQRERHAQCPPGAPCAQPPPERVTVAWRVESAQAFAITGDGAVRPTAFAPPALVTTTSRE